MFLSVLMRAVSEIEWKRLTLNAGSIVPWSMGPD